VPGDGRLQQRLLHLAGLDQLNLGRLHRLRLPRLRPSQHAIGEGVAMPSVPIRLHLHTHLASAPATTGALAAITSAVAPTSDPVVTAVAAATRRTTAVATATFALVATAPPTATRAFAAAALYAAAHAAAAVTTPTLSGASTATA